MARSDTTWTRRPTLLLIVAFWTVVGLVYFYMSFFVHWVDGRPFDAEKAGWTMVAWWSWIPVSYPIFWLAWRFPLDRQHWLVTVPMHLAGSVVASLCTSLVFKSAQALVATLQGAPYAFVDAMRQAFSNYVAFDAVVYLAILAMAHAMNYHRRLRAREVQASELKAQLAEARLQTLKMQIQPHFLFNAFNTISMLVRQQRDEEAVEMISSLSHLFRYILKHAEHQEVSLHKELDMLERYLAMERVRFREPLRLERKVTAEALRGRVPSLLLQPLVENAIRHGIEPSAASGVLRVEAWRRGDRLCLRLLDNGSGLPEGWTLDACAGVGLANTRERLGHLYGAAHVLRAGTLPEGGTVLHLELPYHASDDRADRPALPREPVPSSPAVPA